MTVLVTSGYLQDLNGKMQFAMRWII